MSSLPGLIVAEVFVKDTNNGVSMCIRHQCIDGMNELAAVSLKWKQKHKTYKFNITKSKLSINGRLVAQL